MVSWSFLNHLNQKCLSDLQITYAFFQDALSYFTSKTYVMTGELILLRRGYNMFCGGKATILFLFCLLGVNGKNLSFKSTVPFLDG